MLHHKARFYAGMNGMDLLLTNQMKFEGKYFIPYLYLGGFYPILLSINLIPVGINIFSISAISYLFLSERKKSAFGEMFF